MNIVGMSDIHHIDGHSPRADNRGCLFHVVALTSSVSRRRLAVSELCGEQPDDYCLPMNENHAQLCPSPEWAEHIQQEVLPFLESQVQFGDALLEVGPGPGAATEWLRHRVKRLVAVEIDVHAARELERRFDGSNVVVVLGDASHLDFANESFDTVATFTMLHHVPSVALQNQILVESFRVLRPGGALIGSDSLMSDRLHHFHAGDTYNPVEPAALLTRFQTLGFTSMTIAVDNDVRFIARKPFDASECKQ